LSQGVRSQAATSETFLILTLLEIPGIDLFWHMRCSVSLRFETRNEPVRMESPSLSGSPRSTGKGDLGLFDEKGPITV
jgi:hypothetical protein